jgi:hypothetical protein
MNFHRSSKIFIGFNGFSSIFKRSFEVRSPGPFLDVPRLLPHRPTDGGEPGSMPWPGDEVNEKDIKLIQIDYDQ